MIKLASNHAVVCWMYQQFKSEVYQIQKPPMYNAIALGHSLTSGLPSPTLNIFAGVCSGRPVQLSSELC